MEDASGDDHNVRRADGLRCHFERGCVCKVEPEGDDFRMIVRRAAARAGMDTCAARVGRQLIDEGVADAAGGAEDRGGVIIPERGKAHGTALPMRDPWARAGRTRRAGCWGTTLIR